MSNNAKEQQLKILHAYVNHLHEVIQYLQGDNLQQYQIIEEQSQRIAKLEDVLYYLEREKWSIESELENLRGY